MNKDDSVKITSSDLYYIVFGTIVGTGILSIANSQVKAAHQDGWLSVIIGAIYPIIIVFIWSFVMKKFPYNNILVLSENFFGKYIGNIFNFVFLTFFFSIAILIISGFNNVMIIYATTFIKSIEIIAIVGMLGGYVVYKGLVVLTKINKLFFYANIIIIIFLIPAFKRGTYLNILPLFQASFTDLLKGAEGTLYSYAGVEILFLLSPYVSDKNKIKRKSLAAIFTVVFIYFLSVVTAVYYYGPDIVAKSSWSLVNVSESVRITVINNFRFVFSSMWIVIALKIFSNYYYACTTIIEHMFKRSKREYICVVLYLIILISSIKFMDEIYRREFIDFIAPIYVSFIVIFTILIAVFSIFKVGIKDEKN